MNEPSATLLSMDADRGDRSRSLDARGYSKGRRIKSCQPDGEVLMNVIVGRLIRPHPGAIDALSWNR